MSIINKKILIIIPAFNEERCIAEVVRNISNSTNDSLNILVVNDGSSDQTSHNASQAGAIVLDLPFNLGYGSALQAGYHYAIKHHYDIIVQMDGDGQHDPVSICDIIKPILNNQAKVVIGSRYLGRKSYKTSPLRRLGQRLYSIFLKLLTGRVISDPTSGFQAIHRDVLSLYTSQEFPSDYPDVDVLLLLHLRNIPFCEINAKFHSRTDGKSMHSGLKPIYYIFKMPLSMLLISYRYRRKIAKLKSQL